MKPMAFEQQKVPDDERGSGNREQRLGYRIRQGPQPCTEAAAKIMAFIREMMGER
jgi:hypothetical protein